MAEMSSRERVLAAINHEVPDRVPLILGVDHSTSIAQQAYRKLKQSLDFDAPEHYLHGTWRELGSVRMDEEVLIRLGSDGRGVWDRKSRAIELRNETRDAGSDYVDEFGVGEHFQQQPDTGIVVISSLVVDLTVDHLEIW